MHRSLRAVSRRALAGLTVAIALLGAGAAPAAAQRNPCTVRHPMVDDVRFRGIRALPATDVALEVSTERTGVFRRWFGWRIGPLTCLDSADLVADARQVEALYRDRGYIGATVAARVERHGDRRARVTFDIQEGAPVAVTQVTVAGLPADGGDSVAVRRRLMGTPLDVAHIDSLADSLQAALRDAGYARARPRAVETAGDTARRAGTVRLTFLPGPVTWIGDVGVRVTPDGARPVLGDPAILRAFGVAPGERFSARRIADGQRRIAALDLYRTVRIDTVSRRDALGAATDTIGLAMTLAETDRRRLRTTAGWGTLDCFRTQARLVEQNVAGTGHRLELTGRLSKIGLDAPFTALRDLCAGDVRNDLFSQRLNYYAGATLRLRNVTSLRDPHVQPEFTLFSERRTVVGAYEQTTDIGAVASATHDVGDRLEATVRYAYTDSRTLADRAVSCTRFGFCRLEDVTSFVLRTPQHTIGASLTRNPLSPTDDPANGYRWGVEAKYGHANIGRILPIDFGRVTGEAAGYYALGPWVTLAVHAQAGVVIAPADRSFLLPPSERFYGGGQNSVRGYGQNRLGPGSYIVTEIDTMTGADGRRYGAARASGEVPPIAPSGGNAMWVTNIELRTRRGWPNDLLRWVVFLDAGRVWNTRDVFSVTNADARATPGVGVRLVTPLGPFRVDVGYNPNALDHGPAFVVIPGDASRGVAGRAVCVSPGTTDPLTLAAGEIGGTASCPASFLPTGRRSLLSRLTFHFSLGNAF
jgi:outer membrane protein assembly factor BamA